MAVEIEQTITLESSDSVKFECERKVAEQSTLVKNLLEDLGQLGGEAIPIPNITGAVLEKVLLWCKHHMDDPTPASENRTDSRNRSIDIPEWDREFMQVDQEMVYELILAANYLDIRGLLDVGCQTIANMIKGKSPEDIRRTLNIECDLTPQEEARLRRETEWAEDR